MNDIVDRYLASKDGRATSPFRRITDALAYEITRLRAEVDRLRAGGCARDQTTTQYCAEAARLAAENEKLREALREAADELDTYYRAEYPSADPYNTRKREHSLASNPARRALAGTAEQEKPNE